MPKHTELQAKLETGSSEYDRTESTFQEVKSMIEWNEASSFPYVRILYGSASSACRFFIIAAVAVLHL